MLCSEQNYRIKSNFFILWHKKYLLLSTSKTVGKNKKTADVLTKIRTQKRYRLFYALPVQCFYQAAFRVSLHISGLSAHSLIISTIKILSRHRERHVMVASELITWRYMIFSCKWYKMYHWYDYTTDFSFVNTFCIIFWKIFWIQVKCCHLTINIPAGNPHISMGTVQFPNISVRNAPLPYDSIMAVYVLMSVIKFFIDIGVKNHKKIAGHKNPEVAVV